MNKDCIAAIPHLAHFIWGDEEKGTVGMWSELYNPQYNLTVVHIWTVRTSSSAAFVIKHFMLMYTVKLQ